MREFAPIGVLRTSFTEKFGAPRQSGMVSEARGVLKLRPEPGFREALQHLETFSHVWLVFVFHQHEKKGWRPTIEPPRIDAPKRVGVFASRSPHRPNPIGLSAVKLERVDLDAPGGAEIHLSGVDILDQTPVLDIKPYLPYADSIPTANSGWAGSEIRRYPVEYSTQALEAIREQGAGRHPNLQAFITQMIEWDPRPRSQRDGMPIEDPRSDGKRFGFRIFDFDVQWVIRDAKIYIIDLIGVSQ